MKRFIVPSVVASCAPHLVLAQDEPKDPGVLDIINKATELKDEVLKVFEKLSDEATLKASESREAVKNFSDTWLTFWSYSAGIPGLAQDFVFNYLGREAFHNKNGPIVIGFREFASLLGNSATSDDPKLRKKEFKNIQTHLEATVRDLVMDSVEIFKPGALRSVMEDLGSMLQKPKVMEKMYMHGKPIGKVFEWLSGPRMSGGKPAPVYGGQPTAGKYNRPEDVPTDLDDDDDDLDLSDLDDDQEEL